MNRRSFLKFSAAAAVGTAMAAAGIKPPLPSAPEATEIPYYDPHHLMWNGLPVRIDPNCPEDRIYFIDLRYIFRNSWNEYFIAPGSEKAFAIIKL